MKVNKSYRFRLYPNKEQEQILVRQFGACRFVFNHFLRARIDYYAMHKDERKKGLSYYDTARMLTKMKRQPEYVWLNEANSQSLQQSLRHLDAAYSNFFNKKAKFPRFKSKRDKQSFTVPQNFWTEDEHLRIPKVSPIRIVEHRPIEGEVKHTTISKVPSGKYYASFCCEVDLPEPQPKPKGKEIGIDLGLKSFLVASNGERIDAPKYLRQAEKRLARLQRRLSRRKKESHGREKARIAVARQHEKVANQRSDFLHKLSRRLVDENQAIYVESLNVKGMLANHCLAKSIADAGWGEFLWQLKYKGFWHGCYLGEIDRFFPSSKRHHACGWINKALTLADREWVCQGCGEIVDRDWNAAQNILTFGQASRAGAARTETLAEIGNGQSLKPETQALGLEWLTSSDASPLRPVGAEFEATFEPHPGGTWPVRVKVRYRVVGHARSCRFPGDEVGVMCEEAEEIAREEIPVFAEGRANARLDFSDALEG